VYGLFYCFAKELIKTEKKLRITESEKLKAEKNSIELEALKNKAEAHAAEMEALKIKAEYNFLKTQINPHFLYNTLNMFYGQTVNQLPNTAQGLMLLTEIMRYSLNTGDPEGGRVNLDDEIEQLNNYIELQQLRFNNGLQVKMQVSGHTSTVRILPHVFITFAENAIKHGDTNDKNHPVTITIAVTDEAVQFEIKNKLSRSVKDGPGTNLGIANAVNRLKLQYADRLYFAHGQEGDFYRVFFSIKITAEMIINKNNIPILQTADIAI
jgi:LytS/YehU family sensor histidine kinase